MVIYIDLDNTLCDTYKATQRYVNEYYDDSIVIEREKLISNRTIPWLIDAGIPKGLATGVRNDFSGSLEYWVEYIPIADGAYDIMKYLCKHHQVHIATSVFLINGIGLEPYNCMKGKAIWLKRNLPFYNIENTIYTNFKYNLIGDVLIEDAPQQLDGFRGRKIVRDYPYNRDFKEAERFVEWSEIETILL